MSHISYWMQAVHADSSMCSIAQEQLPAIRSIRFCRELPESDPDILYLGSTKDLTIMFSMVQASFMMPPGLTFFMSGYSKELLELARRLRVTLICSEMDIFSMYNVLETLLRQYQDWQHRFDTASSPGHSIQDIVDTAASISGFSIFLLNIANRVIYKSVRKELKEPWIHQLDQTGYPDEEARSRLLDDAEQSRAVLKELPSGEICWVYKVTKQGTAISNMLFITQNEHRRFDAYSVMDMTRQAIHRLMKESTGPSYWAGEHFRELLKKVTENTELNLYEINECFSRISCTSGIFCSFIIIEFSHPQTLVRRSTPILTELESLFPDNNAAVYENAIVLLLSRPDRAFQPRPIFDTDAFDRLLIRYDAYAAISNATSRRSLTRTQYIMTKDILRLGRQLFPDPKNRVYYYEDLAEYFMIEQTVIRFREHFGHDDITLLMHPDAIKLIRYDMDHQTSLLEFVYHYCLSSGNLALTAQHAFMHRNTASARLARIKELIQADLEDGQVRQRMIYSYKVYQYYSHCSDTTLEKRIELGYTLKA